jgi:hypothetical protein
MTTVHIKKLVNALIPDAAPGDLVGARVRTVTDGFKAAYGGLWVGGSVTVTSDALDFVPNSLNKAVHSNLQPVHIPLAAVRSVRRQFGIVTGIVVVELEGAEFRFRCFNARGVAEKMAGLLQRQALTA